MSSINYPNLCSICAAGRVPDAVCAGCGNRNWPGHERRDHRSFVPTLDPTGAGHLCGLCAVVALAEGGPFGVTLVFDAPAVEVAR